MWVGRCTCPNWISDVGPVGVHVEREGELEQLLPLVPVDVRVDVDRGRPGVEGEQLRDRRGAGLAHDPYRRLGRPALDDRQLRDVGEVAAVAAVVLVDVPGVPLRRGVAVQLQQVRRPRRVARARGRRRGRAREVSRPAAVDHHPDRAVVEHDAVVGLARRAPRRARPRPAPPPSAGTPSRAYGPALATTSAVARRRPAPRARPRSPSRARSATRRSCARPPGAPRRSRCRAGCRGTAAAARSASSVPARRPGSRRRPGRPRWRPTARPRAAGARCAGCRAWCGPAWCRCRGGTPGTARPTTPAGAGTPPRPSAKNSAGVVDPDGRASPRATGCGPRRRASPGSGPPPPSPQPNGTSEVLARPFSAYCRCGPGQLRAGQLASCRCPPAGSG